jgi:hypothetical protein
MNDLATL